MNRVRTASVWRSARTLYRPSSSFLSLGCTQPHYRWSSSTPATPTPEPPKAPEEEEVVELPSPKWDEALVADRKVDARVVGLERIEALGLAEELAGEAVLTGPFGTKDNPVVVHSYFNSRIVGCQGGPGDLSHDLLWHEVRREKPLVCLECGQFFVLKPHPLKERTEEIIRELHDHHSHELEHQNEVDAATKNNRGYYSKYHAEKLREASEKAAKAGHSEHDHKH